MPDRKEYIERGWITGVLPPKCPYTDKWGRGYNACLESIKNLIREAPAADLAEVVRCSRCKHYKTIGTVAGCARIGFECKNPDDYCSYGERKDNATDNNVGGKIDSSDERPDWQQSMLRTFGGDADV